MVWAPDYATTEEVRDYLRIGDSADDAFLATWITTVSRNVDDFCKRQFGIVAAPEIRQYAAVYSRTERTYIAEIDDVMDVDDAVVVDGNAAEVTDLEWWPLNAVARGRPYTQLRTSAGGRLAISAPWGWTPGSAGPAAAKTGLFLQAARLAARRDAPFGIAGSPSEGSELRLLAQLDPDFRTSLQPFRRRWWAG